MASPDMIGASKLTDAVLAQRDSSGVVLTFKTEEEVQAYLTSALNVRGESHLDSAQVLNLDTMKLDVINSDRPKRAGPGSNGPR